MATFTIIVLNLFYFSFMILSGVDAFNPSAGSIHFFGGNFGPDIVAGEYWRLLLSNYIHIGFIHLLFNMWCLYSIGLELENFIGSYYFILIYTFSGIIGSLTSFFINYNIIGAGASGAVFGISGALLVTIFYINKKSINTIQYNYYPLLIFIGYNVFYGFLVPGIDNAAHIGGLISGFLLGFAITIISD